MARVRVDKGAVADAALVALIMIGLLGLGSAWLLMLLFGMFAGYLGIPGLAIGYWASYGIYLMVRLTFGGTSNVD